MATVEVKCPACNKANVVKIGKHKNGAQRYLYQNHECPKKTFILEYTNKGCEPGKDEIIINMAANASGIRDTARVLGISTQKVLNTLKKVVNPKPNQSKLFRI